MSSIATQLNYTYNLNHGVRLTILPMAFLTGNKEGHTFYISVVDNKGPVDLSDVSVSGWFIPNDKGLIDDLSVPLRGRIESNTAILSLPQEAYLETGRFSIVINLNKNGKTSTIFWGTGNVSRSNTDSLVDVGDVIPSLEDLLAQISRIEKAITDANAAKDAANTAAKYANDEAKKIDGLTVDAKSTDMPSAEVSMKNGVRHISFGLVTPRITFEVETGAAGTDAEIKQSGTPENPIVKLTIPRGDTGNINGLDYYEGNPAALGTASPGTTNGVARGNHVHPMPSADDVGARPNTWMPSADDVGALPSDGTAANASKLGGNNPEYYMPDYGRGELLWSGNWSSGEIKVHNSDRYNGFKISMSGQGTAILAMKQGSFVRGVGGYSSATPTINTYHFNATFEGDVWTFVACNSMTHTPNASHGNVADNVVTGIYGLF